MGSLDINTFIELFENSQSTDATMLSEMLWLAKYLKSEKSYYTQKIIEEKKPIKQDDKSKPIEPKENEPTYTKEEKNPPNDKAQEILAYEEKDIPLYISRTKKRGNQITIKHKGFFEDRKNISKYLYHFKEKIASKRNCYLDEQKIVDFIAQTDIVIPYFKPKKQKRYKLILFIDKSNSTKVWQDMLNEYKQILQKSGVFKSTEIIYFTANREDYNFFKDSKETISFNPNEITNYFKDKLIFVLTDMVNMKKEIFEAFVKLYENIPLFIMQILPPRLWRSTFLKEASIATLQSINSYPYSSHSYISEIDYMLDEIETDFIKLPIVQMDLPSLKVIGNVLKAKEDNSIDGAIFNKNITFVKEENQNTLTPLEEIKRFFANASANAQLLVKSLSPIPLTMPIMKMVQEKILNKTDNIYLAEILNSNILNKIDDTFFDFKKGVRDELLKLLGREKALEIAYKNSDYIQENLGAKFGFKALLKGEVNLEEIDFSQNDEIFALVSCKVLKMLNKEYAKKVGCEGTGTIPVIIPTSKRFKMGSKEYGDEQPVHEVVINYDFEIAKYPVTFEEYDLFCEDTGREKPNDQGWGRGKRPVINVSWYDAKAYCKWLSEKTGENYRLPTEAEWEFACRAGTTTKWSFGDDVVELKKYACYDSTSIGSTDLVGKRLPNSWKLFDMYGNIWEWCEDDYLINYNKVLKDGKPMISTKVGRKVIRGGSWYDSARETTSSSRSSWSDKNLSITIGFRLLRTLPSDEKISSIIIENTIPDKKSKDIENLIYQIENRIMELETFYENLIPYSQLEYTYSKEEFSNEKDVPGNHYLISEEFDSRYLNEIIDEIEDDISQLQGILEQKDFSDKELISSLLKKQYKTTYDKIEESYGIDKDCKVYVENRDIDYNKKLLFVLAEPKEESDRLDYEDFIDLYGKELEELIQDKIYDATVGKEIHDTRFAIDFKIVDILEPIDTTITDADIDRGDSFKKISRYFTNVEIKMKIEYETYIQTLKLNENKEYDLYYKPIKTLDNGLTQVKGQGIVMAYSYVNGMIENNILKKIEDFEIAGISLSELLPIDEEKAINEIKEWFFEHYEDPAERLPYENKEGGYQLEHGSLEDAENIIYEKFGVKYSEAILDKAIDEIGRNEQWSPIPQSEEAYIKELKKYRLLAKENSEVYLPYVATALYNLAFLYSDGYELNKAVEAYMEALQLYRKLAQNNPSAYNPYVATTLNNLANLYSDRNELDKAEEAYSEALQLYRELAQNNPSAYNPDVAMTLNNLANLYSDRNELDKAEEAYSEALQLYRELAKENHKVYLPYVATTLNNLANFYSKDSTKRTEAEKYYKEALVVREALEKIRKDKGE